MGSDGPTQPHSEASAQIPLASPGDVRVVLFSPRGEVLSAAVAGVLLVSGLAAHFGGASALASGLYWGSLVIGLIHGFRAAMLALRDGHFDIDVLMAVAAILAAVMGAPGEGALLLFLFVLAGGLEGLATERTSQAVRALHKLMPTKALRLQIGGSVDDWLPVTPEELVIGDRIKILPGEAVPADAVLERGYSSVDQASLTGESMPRSVQEGDLIYAGTINTGNPLEARVLKPASESSLQRVLNLVMEAQQQREPVQRLIDRVSQPYAIGVMLVSIAVFLIWWLGFGAWWRDALHTAITLLIVASPCAVIISTPTATLAGIARAARGGVLFKGGQAIERLARLGAVAFDKTGTLTVGRMRVHEVHPVGWSDENRLLEVAAGLERDSTHPIAAAIIRAALDRSINPPQSERPGFTAGRGVFADFDGKPARLGTLVFVEELIPVCLRARVQEVISGVQHQGRIGVVIAHDEQAGVIILADSVRPGAAQLVRLLHEQGIQPVVMLTGDNRMTARAISDVLGLDRFHAELLPADKVARVQELKAALRADPARRRLGVGVIGDGVNDAPALAAADVSIAIGSIGSEAALESADIVLLADDLSIVPWAVGLARRVRRTIAANLVFALGAIGLMVLATLVGSRLGYRVPMWMGVLGHEGGTLLVVSHSLALLLYGAPTRVGGLTKAHSEETCEQPETLLVGSKYQ